MKDIHFDIRRRCVRAASPCRVSRSSLLDCIARFAIVIALCHALLSEDSFSQSRTNDLPDSTRKAEFTVLPWPIGYYTPETGIAGGAALVGVHRAALEDSTARPSSFVLNVIYTQKKQIIAKVSPDVFLDSAMYHVVGPIYFSRYPLRFYGIGNNTPDDLEEHYTSRTFRVALDALRRIADGFSGGVSFLYDTQTLSELRPGGLLEQAAISGSSGGKTVGAGVVFHWDTRDNIFTPSSGHYCLLTLRTSKPGIGSDFNFTYFNLDLRRYLEVTTGSVLAVQALATMTAGDVPFYFLAQLGGSDVMRGYFEGRYREKDLLAVQLEYRFPLFWRIGGVVFAGAGDVAPELSRFCVAQVKPAVGVGLRFMYNVVERVNVRVDFGIGKKSSGLYMTAYEAF
jgi:hypothetical protein